MRGIVRGYARGPGPGHRKWGQCAYLLLVCLLCAAFSAARLSKSGRDKLQFRVHSELERQQEPAAAQVTAT